jgi:hypothetical protein
MQAYELLLREFELRLDNDSGGMAVESSAALLSIGTPPQDDLSMLPGFILGFGTPELVPDAISNRFGPFFEPPVEGPGLWLQSTALIDGSNAPRWYVVFNADGIDLWGVDALPAGTLDVPGILAFGEAQVHVALRVRGASVTGARFEFTGSATCQANLAGLRLATSGTPNSDGTVDGTGSWRLRIDVGSTASLDELIDDPGRLLDTPFSGELHLALGYTALVFPGGQLPVTTVTIDALASSPGDGHLTLGQLSYQQSSLGDLTLGALTVTDANLSAQIANWTSDDLGHLELAGQASITLPSVLDSANTDTSFTGAMRFVRDVDGIRFELGADRITLDPALNLLELTNAQLTLVATLDDSDWSLSVRGQALQSWQRLARRLRGVGLRIQEAPDFPHLLCDMQLDISETNGLTDAAFSLDLALVDPPAGGDAPTPYDGPLGLLPIKVSGMRLRLTATVDDGQLVAWQVAGQGVIASGPGLSEVLPFSDLAIEASVGVARDDDPSVLDNAPSDHHGDVELALRVRNLPPLVVPALDPAAGTIEILDVAELQVWLSDRLEVTAAVTLLADLRGDGLGEGLGIEGWDALFTPLGNAIGGARGWFRTIIPFDDGPLRAEFELRLGSPTKFDLAQLARDVVVRIGGALDVAVPAEGREIDDSLALVEPEALHFAVEFGAAPSLALSASALFTLAGESFDAVLTVAVVNGTPELSLLAGVDDPIHIALSAGELIELGTVVDLEKLVGDTQFGVAAAKRTAVIQQLEALQEALTDLFSAPGMQADLAFEIRNLGIRFRPTDGDRMLHVGGAVRPTQLPGWLEKVLPGGGPSAVLSSSLSSVRIELQMPTAAEGATRVEPLFEFDFAPLVGAPAGSEVFRLVVRSLMVEYNWASNAVRVGWDVGFDLPTGNMVETIGSGIALPDPSPTFQQLASSGKLGVTLTNPPIPTVEWSCTSGDPEDTTQRGVEFVVGIPGQRFVTLFSRQFSLFPTYQMGQPALVLDGGLILGNPPDDTATDPDAFHLLVDLQGGVVQITPTPLGLMLNPAALVPPYLTPQPPYWLFPPHYMADLYANAIVFNFNLPGVLGIAATLERPVPSLSLPALLELGLLAFSGFEVARIPADSPIREVCYIRLSLEARLPIVALLGDRPVPTLNVDLEVNAADLLELAMHLVSGVRDVFETGSDLGNALIEDPDRLVAAIPTAARRFETEIDLLGFTGSGSLQLLTSSDLLEELVLFHESKRRKRYGVAALDDACTQPPPGGPILETKPMLMIETTLSWSAYLNPRGMTPYTSAWQAEQARAERALTTGLENRKRGLDRFIKVRATREAAMVKGMVELLKKSDDPAAYLKLAASTSPIVERYSKVFAEAVDQTGRRPTSGRTLGGWGVRMRNETVRQLADMPMFHIGPGGEVPTIAKAIAERVLMARRATRSLVQVETLPAGDWPQAYKEVVGRSLTGTAPTRARLKGIAKAVDTQIDPRRPMDRRQYQAIEKGLVSSLESALQGTRRGKLVTVKDLYEQLTSDKAERRFRDRWTWDDRKVTRRKKRSLYNGPRSIRLLTDVLVGKPGIMFDPGRNETVERPVGWQVVVSDRLDPPLDIALTPPLLLDSPRAEIAVVFRGGTYSFVVRRDDSSEVNSSPVPSALLAHPEAGAPGPGRPARLRAMVRIVERTVTDVVTRPAADSCSDPTLYQQSLFARPECRIDPTGDGDLVGIHGPLSLADLLRDASGAYRVSPGPVLVAGLKLEMPPVVTTGHPDNEFRLTGLLAPAISPGAAGTVPAVDYSAYLEGYSSLTLPLPGGYVVALSGSFTLIIGELWANSLPGMPDGDALRFDGSLVLKKGNGQLFEGSAHGTLGHSADGIDLDILVEVSVDFSLDIEPEGLELARVWSCTGTNSSGPSTLTVQVQVTDGDQLELSADGGFGLCLATAELEIEQVEIIPAIEVCAMVPLLKSNGEPVLVQAELPNGTPIPNVYVPKLVEECVTVPAVTVPVPTVGELGAPVTCTVAVEFTLGPHPKIDLTITPPAQTGIDPFLLEDVDFGELIPIG